MKNYCHEVTLPLKNHLQAERDIRTLMVNEDIENWSKLVRRPKADLSTATLISPHRPLSFLVDAFMAAYPRGNETKDDRRLRTLYAACKVIKNKSSRARRYSVKLVTFRDMSANQIGYLAKMPLDGSSTTELLGYRASLKKLINLGLVNGYFDDEYNEVEYWLTDDGLRLASFAPNYLADQKLREELENGALDPSSSGVDYEAMRRAILNFNGHDAKTFVENAAKIVRLLGGAK
jgi:hypothetical protein